jgi:hypothetical protein
MANPANARTYTAAGAAATRTPTFTGKTGEARKAAFDLIPFLVFRESMSRKLIINNLRKALGSKPSESLILSVANQVQAGRIAERLPASEFPKGCTSEGDCIAHALALIYDYAMPTAKKLTKGKVGRRSETQHKAIRAANEYWSQLKAELNIGNAQTQKTKNDKKAAKAKGANNALPKVAGANGVVVTPSHDDLVKGKAPASQHDYVATLLSLTSGMEGYVQKNAKQCPNAFNAVAQKIIELRRMTLDAANAYQLERDDATGKRAEKQKV